MSTRLKIPFSLLGFDCLCKSAFSVDSYIVAEILSEAIKRGVDPSVINCLCYMYSHLKAKIKGGLGSFQYI